MKMICEQSKIDVIYTSERFVFQKDIHNIREGRSTSYQKYGAPLNRIVIVMFKSIHISLQRDLIPMFKMVYIKN